MKINWAAAIIDGLILFGAYQVVFVQNHSAWWILAAVLITTLTGGYRLPLTNEK